MVTRVVLLSHIRGLFCRFARRLIMQHLLHAKQPFVGRGVFDRAFAVRVERVFRTEHRIVFKPLECATIPLDLAVLMLPVVKHLIDILLMARTQRQPRRRHRQSHGLARPSGRAAVGDTRRLRGHSAGLPGNRQFGLTEQRRTDRRGSDQETVHGGKAACRDVHWLSICLQQWNGQGSRWPDRQVAGTTRSAPRLGRPRDLGAPAADSRSSRHSPGEKSGRILARSSRSPQGRNLRSKTRKCAGCTQPMANRNGGAAENCGPRIANCELQTANCTLRVTVSNWSSPPSDQSRVPSHSHDPRRRPPLCPPFRPFRPLTRLIAPMDNRAHDRYAGRSRGGPQGGDP